MSQVQVSPHPLVQHKLTLLRRTVTEPKKFRELVRELSQFLLYEATLDLPLNPLEIETPLAPLEPVTYYNKLPPDVEIDLCLVLDPMLATGGSAIAAVDILKRWGATRI